MVATKRVMRSVCVHWFDKASRLVATTDVAQTTLPFISVLIVHQSFSQIFTAFTSAHKQRRNPHFTLDVWLARRLSSRLTCGAPDCFSSRTTPSCLVTAARIALRSTGAPSAILFVI